MYLIISLFIALLGIFLMLNKRKRMYKRFLGFALMTVSIGFLCAVSLGSFELPVI